MGCSGTVDGARGASLVTLALLDDSCSSSVSSAEACPPETTERSSSSVSSRSFLETRAPAYLGSLMDWFN